MKKIIFYAVVLASVTLVSCAKEYDCECEIEHKESAQGYNYSYKFEEEATIKAKENSAKEACEELNYEESTTDDTGIKQEIIQKCNLK